MPKGKEWLMFVFVVLCVLYFEIFTGLEMSVQLIQLGVTKLEA